MGLLALLYVPRSKDILESISYIVPTLNEANILSATLDRIQELSGSKEIIVADGGSTDATLEIAKEFSCSIVHSEIGRGTQMNAAANLANAPLLCFVHADTLLPKNTADEIRSSLSRPSVVAGSFRLAFDTPGKRLSFYAYCSRINSTLFTYGDQCLYLRKETFEKIGGFRPYPFLEDIEIQKRLRSIGKFNKSKESVTTSARRFQTNGPLKQQILNLTIVSGYLLGLSPQFLRRFYQHVR